MIEDIVKSDLKRFFILNGRIYIILKSAGSCRRMDVLFI